MEFVEASGHVAAPRGSLFIQSVPMLTMLCRTGLTGFDAIKYLKYLALEDPLWPRHLMGPNGEPVGSRRHVFLARYRLPNLSWRH